MTAVIDPRVFAELQANAGADFIAELVTTFGEEAPLLLAELHSAQTDGAAERFRRAAHALKSNSLTFGALQMAEMARTLELNGVPASAEPVQALAAEFGRVLPALESMAAAGGA